MGLECKACGAKVVSGVNTCPACGTELSNKMKYLRVAAFLVVGVLVAKSYMDKAAVTEAEQAPPAQTSEQ